MEEQEAASEVVAMATEDEEMLTKGGSTDHEVEVQKGRWVWLVGVTNRVIKTR